MKSPCPTVDEGYLLPKIGPFRNSVCLRARLRQVLRRRPGWCRQAFSLLLVAAACVAVAWAAGVRIFICRNSFTQRQIGKLGDFFIVSALATFVITTYFRPYLFRLLFRPPLRRPLRPPLCSRRRKKRIGLQPWWMRLPPRYEESRLRCGLERKSGMGKEPPFHAELQIRLMIFHVIIDCC